MLANIENVLIYIEKNDYAPKEITALRTPLPGGEVGDLE